MSLHIDSTLLRQIWAHGEGAYPEEGAGLILGTDDGERRVARVIYPVTNVYEPESRHNRYLIDPRAMLRAEAEAERMGLEVIGVFHSHPDHPAGASDFDRQWAVPWYSYLITCVQGGKACESRCWRLRDDRSEMTEEDMIIDPISIQQEA